MLEYGSAKENDSSTRDRGGGGLATRRSSSLSPSACPESGAAREQFRQRSAGALLAHEGFADEDGTNAVPVHQFDVSTRQDAAFGDDNPVGRNARQEVERRLQRDLERAQIPPSGPRSTVQQP